MPTAKKEEWISVDQYLAMEERARIKHEYIDGRIFAMSGVTRRHNRIALNIFSILSAHLMGSPCAVYISDLKVHVKAANSFYYPDVVVTCGVHDDRSSIIPDPVLLVEVLSRSTASIDRREKVLSYRQIPSLREYLIVDYKKKHVEMHRKDEAGSFQICQFFSDDEMELASMPVGPLKVRLTALYKDTGIEHQTDLEVREEGESYLIYAEEDDDDDDESIEEEID